MSNSADSPRRRITDPAQPFGGDDILPIEKQRRAQQFLTQETRYAIILATLGHPDHLVTLDELEYLVPKNRSTIREHLDQLEDKQVMTQYTYDGEEGEVHDPKAFWGFTEYGIILLDEYDYLRYVPIVRALQETLYLTEKIQRHRDAPRPNLPTAVAEAFNAPALDAETAAAIDETIDKTLAARERSDGRIFDAPPIEPDPDADTEDGADRPIDELF